jgi:RNA polymerase sigma-70 factor (ECF subfamily)
VEELIEKAKSGDAVALAELFGHHRRRLRAMVELRLDRRLRGRVDPSDVLQEAFIDLAKRLERYTEFDDLPFYLWLRMITGQRLQDFHRKHLLAAKRDVRQEVNLNRNSIPAAHSASLAASLLGRETSVAAKAIRAEMQVKLQEVLNDMNEIDREIIVLRHFEEMSNSEAALALGLSKTAAGNRYVRALKRLKDTLDDVPGLLG